MTRAQSIEEIAAHINPEQAQQFAAEVMHILGSAPDWSADQLEEIARELIQFTFELEEIDVIGVWYDRDEYDIDYWQGLDSE